jgi:hypothetical protein
LKKIVLSLALILGLTACKSQLPPNATDVEKQVYADLYTAQTVLEDLKAQEPQYPQIKDSLNVALAAYNLAEKAFVAYEKSKAANLANPADLLKIQAEVLDIKSSIATLTTTIQEVK